MRNTVLLFMMSAAVVFTSCGNGDDTVPESNDVVRGGMTLTATVAENGGTRATIGDGENGKWKFAFAENDEIKVRNADMESDAYYTFKKGETTFTSADAEPTTEAVDWYAYFPGTEVSLGGQNYTDKSGVAAKYALAGKTATATDGKSGLSIKLEHQVAVLVIENHLSLSIDINVKTGGKWVSGLKAKESEAGFDVQTSDTKVTLLSATDAGTYYVAVPAGVKIEILNDDVCIRQTKDAGLTAGSYYKIDVNRLCSDDNHPHAIDLGYGTKWACCNVGASSPEDKGGYYAWGETDVKETYTKDNYIYYQNGSYVKIGDDKGIISSTDYDVAKVKMGNSWKMPTDEQYTKLCSKDNSTWKWITIKGVSGILITSKKNSACIFFPVTGYRENGDLKWNTTDGYYWVGVPYSDSYVYHFNIKSSGWNVYYNGFRYQGRTVRAVCK